MKIPDLYVVVWINNPLERGLEVWRVHELVSSNGEIFFFDRSTTESDQLVLAVEATREAAQAKLDQFQALLDRAAKKD